MHVFMCWEYAKATVKYILSSHLTLFQGVWSWQAEAQHSGPGIQGKLEGKFP